MTQVVSPRWTGSSEAASRNRAEHLSRAATARSPAGGLIDRARALAFTFDGRELSGPSRRHAGLGAAGQRRARSSAAPSNITGRAASSRPGRRSPTRWSSCAPARGASPTRAPPSAELYDGPGGREPEPLAVARVRPAGRQRAGSRRPVGRLLLQDLHVAGVVLGEGLRAADPPRRRPRARRRRSRSRHLREGASCTATCWSSAAARPA